MSQEPMSYEPPTEVFDPTKPAIIATENTDPQGGLIKYWSHSSLVQFQECPYRLYLRRVKRFKEPSGEAARRGSAIHDECEKFLKGDQVGLPDGKKTDWFAQAFIDLRDKYWSGKVNVEQDWGFDIDWCPLDSDKNIYKHEKLWAVTKLDAFVWEDESSAKIIDYKTGRKHGNEVKHGAQAYTYAISAFMRYPELEHVKAEFWYLDQGTTLERRWTRDEAMLLLPRLTERAIKMTSATNFPARPSDKACKWCHYGKNGKCEYGGKPI